MAKFKNSYDAVGNITQWKQQIGVGATMTRWELKYDAVDQLTIGNKKNDSTGALLEQNGNRYDKLGNRLTKQVDAALKTGTFNNLNQLTSLAAGGAGTMTFEGTVSEPSTVTVGGNLAPVDSSNIYRGEAGVIVGTNNIPIIARDANNNSRTNTARVVVPTATTRSFTYDGQNRCVRVVEKTGGTPTSDKRYLWDGLARAEERDSDGTTVLKQYFSQGFKAGSAKYYYTGDYLGSIWGLVDDAGTVRGLWNYDLWGKRDVNQIPSGAVNSDISYTDHFQHGESNLILAPFRSYDPSTARWLSRDPLEKAEMLQGPNLYSYVSNNSVKFRDSLGLQATMVPGYPQNPFTGKPLPGNPNYRGPGSRPYVPPWGVQDYGDSRRGCNGNDSDHHADAVREAGRSAGYLLGPLYYPVGGAAAIMAAAIGNIAEMMHPSNDWLDDMQANNQGIADFFGACPSE